MSKIVIYSSEGMLDCKPYKVVNLDESVPLSEETDAEQNALEGVCEQSE